MKLQTCRSWREAGAVTLAEAAEIAERSYSWARDKAVDGSLDVLPTDTRPVYVTTASLDALITKIRLRARSAVKRRPGSYLRLVVDNT